MRDREDVNGLLVVVAQDVRDAEATLGRDDSQTHRRHYVRAVFAAIEGTTYSMKYDALDALQDVAGAPIGELALLREEAYTLDEQGRVVASPLFLRLERNIRFTLGAYARGLERDLRIDYSGRGWAALRAAVKVRNRLMHPRAASELTVSEEDLANARTAYEWFTDAVLMTLFAVHQMLSAAKERLESEQRELENRVAELARATGRDH